MGRQLDQLYASSAGADDQFFAFARLAADYQDADKMRIEGSPSFVLNDGRQKLYGNVGFRLIDASGSVVLQIPIAGSGIFGADTCVSSAQRPREVITWAGLDAATYQRILANIATYRLEADAVAGPTVTVPLSDTGCRRP